MVQIINRTAHIECVIHVVFFIAYRITKRPIKAEPTITLLLKLRVIFLLQFLQFHSKGRNMTGICFLYSGIEYLKLQCG